MAIIVRIVSADGKKVISKTLPALPSRLKVPAGATVEVINKETGEKDTLAQYVNENANQTQNGSDDVRNAGNVTIETVDDWGAAEAWLSSMGQLTVSEGSNSEWIEPNSDEGDRLLGFDKNTLFIGGLVGVGIAGAASSLGSDGPKDNTPPGAPRTLDLAAADDTGSSNTDNITSTTSGLTISGLAEEGSKVELFDGTTSIGTATAASDGTFTLDVSLADGVHSITAKATDKAGNVSAESSVLTITVDTTAPAAVTALDLAAADDTGTSNTDNLTSRTSALTITGTAEAGAIVELFDGTTSLGTATANAQGAFSRDVTLTAGTHAITAKATDALGQTGPASEVLTITVDPTSPPSPTALDLAAADDTGSSNSDNNTSKTTELTITGTAEAGSTVELFDGSTSLGTVVVAANGSFSKDVTLTQGARSITARATDAAGGTSAASTALVITVDTTANATSPLDLAAADDTGESTTDNVTNKTSALTITGTGEEGGRVELFDGTTSLGSVAVGDNGSFSLDITLAQGVHSITSKVTDAAGNVGPASQVLTVTVDTTAPAAPSTLDLAADDDTGSSNGDNITSKTSNLTISGTAEAGSTVELFDGTTSLGTVTASANGSFSMDVGLASGTHSITARATDDAGNVGEASPVLTVTVDTTAPAAPAALDLAAADDNGASNSDNVTSQTSGLTITGTAEAGSTVELFDGSTSLGTVIAADNGTFSKDIGLAVGTHSITAKATDAAGNFQTGPTALDITVVASSLSAFETGPELDQMALLSGTSHFG